MYNCILMMHCVVFQAPGCCLPGDVVALLPASVVYYKLQFTIFRQFTGGVIGVME